MRVVAHDGELRVDTGAVAPGRGSWVHPTPECVSQAITRKAFSRALRTPVTNTEALQALLPTAEIPPGF